MLQKVLQILNRSNFILATKKYFRPWGYYQVLYKCSLFQIKQIVVKPKSRLSYQSHHYRSEHWIVVKGNAHVVLNENLMQLDVGQSVFIDKQDKHRLENRSEQTLNIVEIQLGNSFDEGDIIRYEDDYDRV